MTDCPDCIAASERAWHQFTTACMVCQARQIARGPVCAQSRALGYITTAYRTQLAGVAGEVHWQTMHQLVLAWQRGELPKSPIQITVQ